MNDIDLTPLELRARAFAEFHHGAINQRRKYTGEPYIHHPAAVANLVRSVPHTPEMLAAAWLHDTVEDTGATFAEILDNFGVHVTHLVVMLTSVSRPDHGVRAVRKAIDRAYLARATPEAKTIKLADIIDNVSTIVDRDPQFAKVYLAEKAALLEVLREGDPTLYQEATRIIKGRQ